MSERGVQLEPQEIAFVASEAGFGAGSELLAVMTAIAMAESSSWTCAQGDQHLESATWGPSVGLWQVRTLKRERGTGSTRDIEIQCNPFLNARSARTIYQQQGLRAWTVHQTGAYRSHMTQGRAASRTVARLNVAERAVMRQNIAGKVGVDAPNNPLSPFDMAAQIAGGAAGVLDNPFSVLEPITTLLTQRDTWIRIVQTVGGLLLLIVGIVVLGRDLFNVTPKGQLAQRAIRAVS